jgi:hypothetical protein
MEKLRVIGTEKDQLILATESGDRFTLAVDAVLRAELRRSHRESSGDDVRTGRISPREIQAQIRAGLSTADAAELLGVSIDTVARYEGPVLAERQHVVGQALSVPVLVANDFDSAPTFGAAVRRKLAEANATGEHWTSWKEPTGWVVKLDFTAGEVERDARWTFDPRRSTLSPLNPDAVQLSRQGSLPEGLIPRLRALDNAHGDARPVDVRDEDRHEAGPRRTPLPAADVDVETDGSAAAEAAIKRAPERSRTSSETADLLDALRRRRGQRESLPMAEPARADTPAPAPLALFDALEPGYDGPDEEDGATAPIVPVRSQAAGDGRRKNRPSMPSWDEIVFGARSDES